MKWRQADRYLTEARDYLLEPSILDVLWRGIAAGMAATANHRVTGRWDPAEPFLTVRLGPPEHGECVRIVLRRDETVIIAVHSARRGHHTAPEIAGVWGVSKRYFDLADPDCLTRLAEYLWTFGVPFAEE